MGQFIAVLDVQIVSSSLAVIQSGVGASSEEISWIQTSYLIAETLAIPLVGFFTQTFGLRRMFVSVCGAFTIASLAVGLAYDLPSLILARTIQGFVGGLMLPLAFTFGFSAFPKSIIGKISLIISIIGVLAPTVGPVIGGYVSDWLDWRWLFFINIPLGGIAVAGVGASADSLVGKQFPPPSLDWKSLAALMPALMAAQFVLEEGQRRDWLDSNLIVVMVAIALSCGMLFIHRSLTFASPLINLKVFARHDYRGGWLLINVGGLSLFGGSYLLPLFLAEVRGYSPLQTGETLIVSGAVMVLSGLLVMPRLKKFDLRIPIACGFAVTGYGYWLGHDATAQWDFWELAALQTWRGLGVIIAITGTQTLTMGRVPPALTSSATSLLYLARNLGGAAGVALLSTTLTAQTRRSYDDFAMGSAVRVPYLSLPGTGSAISEQVFAAARVMAFDLCFALIALACGAAALIALTLGPRRSEQ